jgi:phage-related minor tail protein
MRAMRLLVGVGVVGLIACGESAEDQCKEVMDAVCDKVVECSKAEGDAALDLENKCLQALKPSCGEAKSELDSVDACISEIKSASCDDFEAGDGEFTPPLQRACTTSD